MTYDVVIVGGSFAGLSAAMQLGRARRKVLIVDAGLPRNRFASAAHGFFGHDGKPPQLLLGTAREQVLAYPTVSVQQGVASQAAPHEGGFAVTVEDGKTLHTKRLVLAGGVRDRLPAIPGLSERWGTGVLHCPYCHGYELRDRPLGVLANHVLSPHQGQLIPEWGPTTYFTQGDQFPVDEAQAADLRARGVTIETSPIVELLGNAPALEAVRLADGRVLPCAGLFTAPATEVVGNLAQQLGLAMNDGPSGAFIRVDGFQASSVPGVFAAGDAAMAMHNATLASAAGVMAGAMSHRSLLFP